MVVWSFGVFAWSRRASPALRAEVAGHGLVVLAGVFRAYARQQVYFGFGFGHLHGAGGDAGSGRALRPLKALRIDLNMVRAPLRHWSGSVAGEERWGYQANLIE